MPDIWEQAHGLNPNSANDAAAYTLDPKGYYTNIEVYCNALVEDLVKAQNTDAESSVDEYYPTTTKVNGIDYFDGTQVATGDSETPANAISFTIAASTHTTNISSTEWGFKDGITLSNKSGKTYSTGKEDGIKYSADIQYFITLPDSVSITDITMSGYDNYKDTDAYIKELNGVEYSATDYVYPQKDTNENYFWTSHHITLDTPTRGSITFTPAGKQVVWVITLNGLKDVKKIVRGDLNNDGYVTIEDIMLLVNIFLGIGN